MANEFVVRNGLITHGNVDLSGNSIVSSGDLSISTSGGNIVISGNKFPSGLGQSNYVLTTDGAGNLSWSSVAGGGPTPNTFQNVAVGGQTLTANASTDTLTVNNGNGITLTGVAGTRTMTIAVNESQLTLGNLGGSVGVSKGGTGLSSVAVNSLLVGNGTGAMSVLAPSAGYLNWNGSSYGWATPTTYSSFTGATSSVAGSTGLVPQPQAGDDTKFLKGDGTWFAIPGSSPQNAYQSMIVAGNTSTAASPTASFAWAAGTGITLTSTAGSNSATLAVNQGGLDLNSIGGGSNVLGVAKGGTGLTTVATNAVVIGGSAGALSSTVAASTGYLYWNGSAFVWQTPSASGAPTTAEYVLGSANGSLTSGLVLGGTAGQITVTKGSGTMTLALATSGVSSGTYTKLTVDTYGRVTAASNLVASDLPTMVAATSVANGTQGAVPAPQAGDQVKYLRGDGTWATPAGGGGGTTTQYTIKIGLVNTSGAVDTTTTFPNGLPSGWATTTINSGYIVFTVPSAYVGKLPSSIYTYATNNTGTLTMKYPSGNFATATWSVGYTAAMDGFTLGGIAATGHNGNASSNNALYLVVTFN